MLKMILWLLGGLAVITLICIAALWVEKNFPGKQYDERQQAARGRAYRLGYWVGALWIFVSLLYIMFGGDIDGMLVVLFLGFVAQTLSFHIYCLLNHAAMPLSQKPIPAIVGYGVLAVTGSINAALSSGIDARWPDKPPVNTWIQLSLAVGCGALGVMHLVQYLRNRKG